MPHFHIDYSGNLDGVVDMAAFCDAIRAAAAEVETFPTPGIRVRATRVDHFSVADGDPKHGFVDVSVRLREGRSDAVKHAATQHIFEAAQRFLGPAMAQHSIALSLEMRDINAAFSPKCGSTRDHMEHPS